MGMMDAFKIPKDPHEDEPDELTPDTLPIDDIERPHDAPDEDDPTVSAAKDLDEPGTADRTPRP